MNLRRQKKRTMLRMANPSLDYLQESNTYPHIRDVPRCKSYHWACTDCNGHLFRDLYGRFPYSMEEFSAFEDHQHTNHHKEPPCAT